MEWKDVNKELPKDTVQKFKTDYGNNIVLCCVECQDMKDKNKFFDIFIYYNNTFERFHYRGEETKFFKKENSFILENLKITNWAYINEPK